MADRGKIVSVAASAPMEGAGESLVSVLCVEATYKTQRVFDRALAAAATGSAAATEELRKLPGMQLCMSPDTPIHAVRAFLQEQEAVALSSGRHAAADDKEQQNTNSLANAHFFAILVPPVSSEGAEAVEAFLPLQNTATLRDVLASGPVLRCNDDASADAAEQMLLLVYMRESEYGLDGGDFLLGALCAGLCACCIALCASGAARSAGEKRRRRESDQQQQQPQYPQQPYYPNNVAPPPNPGYYPGNMPAGQPYSYGAPPEYPVAQPAYYNYSGQPLQDQSPQPGDQKQVPGTLSPSNNAGAPAPL
ncbi:hypothetical protein, unknown function [Leishmania donovani]|uniref:Uncharacterized protein n=1 Tax=Leishmania donovani TaxID=5661 RepID=E9BHI5_LEIDO|nr:hypothetical protein, unknown function [Leishmania donovani]AYU79413.1 hypothetical protein LdCL_250013400 [Leishmania donovani]CBZ34711.1 hypothetical protein, unknown function [Leishmania donovani]